MFSDVLQEINVKDILDDVQKAELPEDIEVSLDPRRCVLVVKSSSKKSSLTQITSLEDYTRDWLVESAKNISIQTPAV